MMTVLDDGIIMRTIVDLPEPERLQLDAICSQRGISRAEGVRQALRLWLQECTPNHAAVFGLWSHRSGDGLSIQEELRAEWQRP